LGNRNEKKKHLLGGKRAKRQINLKKNNKNSECQHLAAEKKKKKADGMSKNRAAKKPRGSMIVKIKKKIRKGEISGDRGAEKPGDAQKKKKKKKNKTFSKTGRHRIRKENMRPLHQKRSKRNNKKR